MQFSIPADHPCLPGHFPGRPLVPGVVVLEAVLQALAQRGVVIEALRLPQVKFLQPLLPEQVAQVVLEGGLDGELEHGPWRFEVKSQGRIVASGRLERADPAA